LFPYWLLFAACSIGALQYRVKPWQPHYGGALLSIMVVAITLMIGFRKEIGGDWYAYIEIFNSYRFFSLGEALQYQDPAYTIISWLAVRLGLGIWAVNLVCAMVFTWGLSRFVRQQPNPWLGLVVAVPYLIIVVAMGYTRQGAAIGVEMAAIAAFQRNPSLLRFAGYMLLAAAFHKTAIIVFPLVALTVARNRFMVVGISALFAAILFYIFVYSSIDRMVENYVEEDYEAAGAAVRILMTAVAAVLFVALRDRLALPDGTRAIWRNFSYAALAAMIMIFLFSSTVVLDRLALYLIPLQIVVFSRLPMTVSKTGKESGLVVLGVISFYALVQLVWLQTAVNASYWLPYKAYSPF
jgi:hypothetical protein